MISETFSRYTDGLLCNQQQIFTVWIKSTFCFWLGEKNEQPFQTKPFGFFFSSLFSFLLFFFIFLVSVWSLSTKKPGGSFRSQEGNQRVGSLSCFCRTRIRGASLTPFSLRSGIYLPLVFFPRWTYVKMKDAPQLPPTRASYLVLLVEFGGFQFLSAVAGSAVYYEIQHPH